MFACEYTRYMNMYVYIYMYYTYTCTYMHIHIYIYTYIYIWREWQKQSMVLEMVTLCSKLLFFQVSNSSTMA